MRERNARNSVGQRQRAQVRGGARTMPRWLWAAMLVAATGAGAWRPPAEPVLFTPRTRRQAPDNSTHHIHLLGWHLELQENEAIRSPYYNDCQFYKGRVRHENGSKATVTECVGQLYGLLQVGGEEFVLQPTQNEGAHVLRRRDVVITDQTTAYNLTGDTVTDLDLDFGEDDQPTVTSYVHRKDSSRTETEYFRNVQVVTRPVSGVCTSDKYCVLVFIRNKCDIL